MSKLNTRVVESETRSPQKENVLLKVQSGSESERYDGLIQARTEKISLPEETLKALYENDRSEEIRLLAFTYAMEKFPGDATALRRTLEEARTLPDNAIAEDAEQRLEVLARLEQTQFDQLWSPVDESTQIDRDI